MALSFTADSLANWQMWFTFGVVFAGIVAFSIERISIEMTSLAILSILLIVFELAPVTGADGANLLDARRLLGGLADPALISLVSLMVIGHGLIRTDALDSVIRPILSESRPSLPGLSILVLLLVALLSAFFNNTPVVILFIPVMMAIASRLGQSASMLLMPLSFVAILGGSTTLIGSSTNLMVAGSYAALGKGDLGFFSFFLPGIILASVGFLYAGLILPKILPNRSGLVRRATGDGKQYIAELTIQSGSPLVGKSIVAGVIPTLPNMTVRMVLRGEHAFLPPVEDVKFRSGDIVVVGATRQVLEETVNSFPDLMVSARLGDQKDQLLAEAMVTPASRMIGRNLAQIGFHYQTGCIVLGIQRRSRMIRESMNDIRLEAGDVLLLVGSQANITALRANRDVVPLEWSQQELPDRRASKRAWFIFLSVIATAALGLLPISVAALAGGAAMIGTGCLNIHQAARALDRRVILLIIAALAMGSAMQATGGALAVAEILLILLADTAPIVVLSAFFLVVAVMTNILSNNATAVLFTPIAVSIATHLEVPVMAFVVAVIFAANCSFATPFGYQTNLLIMAPGQYHFRDFLKYGTPLVFLLWMTFTFIAPLIYPLG